MHNLCWVVRFKKENHKTKKKNWPTQMNIIVTGWWAHQTESYSASFSVLICFALSVALSLVFSHLMRESVGDLTAHSKYESICKSDHRNQINRHEQQQQQKKQHRYSTHNSSLESISIVNRTFKSMFLISQWKMLAGFLFQTFKRSQWLLYRQNQRNQNS